MTYEQIQLEHSILKARIRATRAHDDIRAAQLEAERQDRILEDLEERATDLRAAS